MIHWCNGYANCDDWYDEHPASCNECKNKTGVTQCEDSIVCIPDSWLCNDFPHCFDISDELSCNRNCDNEDMFTCKDGTMCIPKRSTCNGLNNCPDGSDESFELCKDAPQNGTFR